MRLLSLVASAAPPASLCHEQRRGVRFVGQPTRPIMICGRAVDMRRVGMGMVSGAARVTLLVLGAGCGLGAAANRAHAQTEMRPVQADVAVGPDAGAAAAAVPTPPAPPNSADIARAEASLDTTGQLRQPSGSVTQVGTAIRPAASVPPSNEGERTVAAPRARPAEDADELPAPYMALDRNMGAR